MARARPWDNERNIVLVGDMGLRASRRSVECNRSGRCQLKRSKYGRVDARTTRSGINQCTHGNCIGNRLTSSGKRCHSRLTCRRYGSYQRPFVNKLKSEMRHLGVAELKAGVDEARDELDLFNRVDLFHEERLESECLITVLHGVFVRAEDVYHLLPVDEDKLALVFLQFREFLFVCF